MTSRFLLRTMVWIPALAWALASAGCTCPAGHAYRGLPGLGSCERHNCPANSSPCASRLEHDPPVPPNPDPSIVEVCGCGYGMRWDGSSCVSACAPDESFAGPQDNAPPACVKNEAPNPRREIAEGYSELPRSIRPWARDSDSRGGPTCL